MFKVLCYLHLKYFVTSVFQFCTNIFFPFVFRNSHKISVSYVFDCKSETIPKPVFTFEQAFHCFPEVLSEVMKQKFEKPSPIQCQGWPILLKGSNLIGIAQTGTGNNKLF